MNPQKFPRTDNFDERINMHAQIKRVSQRGVPDNGEARGFVEERYHAEAPVPRKICDSSVNRKYLLYRNRIKGIESD